MGWKVWCWDKTQKLNLQQNLKKKKLWHNLKTLNMMQLKNLNCERKKSQNLDNDKT